MWKYEEIPTGFYPWSNFSNNSYIFLPLEPNLNNSFITNFANYNKGLDFIGRDWNFPKWLFNLDICGEEIAIYTMQNGNIDRSNELILLAYIMYKYLCGACFN